MDSLIRISRFGSLAAVATEWTSWLIFYLMRPHDFTTSHPISYFATQPCTRAVFTIAYILAPVFFYAYVMFYLRRAQTPFVISMVSFVLVAVIPYDPHNILSNAMHIAAFLVSAVAFMIGMYQATILLPRNRTRKWAQGFLVAAGVLFLGLLAAQILDFAPLSWELGWWVSCQAWMITIALGDVQTNKGLEV